MVYEVFLEMLEVMVDEVFGFWFSGFDRGCFMRKKCFSLLLLRSF